MVIITQGETLQLFAKADPSAVVTFYFAGASSHQVVATSTGETFTISVDTTAWTPGAYLVEMRSVLAGVTKVLARHPLNIRPALTAYPAGADLRSEAEKAIANIEAMLAGGATLEARKYKINNRELERYSISELMHLLGYWKRRLASERRKAAGISGLGPRIETYC